MKAFACSFGLLAGDLLELERGGVRWLKRIPYGGQYHDLPDTGSARLSVICEDHLQDRG
jgi:hypothetical protein